MSKKGIYLFHHTIFYSTIPSNTYLVASLHVMTQYYYSILFQYNKEWINTQVENTNYMPHQNLGTSTPVFKSFTRKMFRVGTSWIHTTILRNSATVIVPTSHYVCLIDDVQKQPLLGNCLIGVQVTHSITWLLLGELKIA